MLKHDGLRSISVSAAALLGGPRSLHAHVLYDLRNKQLIGQIGLRSLPIKREHSRCNDNPHPLRLSRVCHEYSVPDAVCPPGRNVSTLSGW